MQTADVVFEHSFDKDMLDQIKTLRTTRLMLAENMLRDLQTTASEMMNRGLLAKDLDPRGMQELRTELQDRVQVLKGRMEKEGVVYADELTLFADLVADSALGD